MNIETWEELEDHILQLAAHEDISVDKEFFDKESLQQFKSIWGDNDGQITNYRIKIESSSKSIHIKEYDDHYKIHWDKANPATDPVLHLIEDAPHHIPAVILGALVLGYLFTRK